MSTTSGIASLNQASAAVKTRGHNVEAAMDAHREKTPGTEAPKVVATILDFETATGRLVRSDGKEAVIPLDFSPVAPTNPIARLTHVHHLNSVHYVTTRRDDIVAELPALDARSSRDGRIVVYLDQKDWRTLRDVRYDPESVRHPEEREAAEALIRLVESREVILPMSSGHMVETTQWSHHRLRYQVALTILQLSRGWQMRHPISIREGELRAALTHRGQVQDLGVHDVFTLAPGAALAGRADRYTPGTGLSPELELAGAALTALSAFFATMLDAEQVPPVTIPGWQERQQELTDWISETRPPRSRADDRIDEFFVEDISYELEQATRDVGISHSQLEAWKQIGLPRDVRRMPSLSLFRELLRERHLNARTLWERSDLIDAMYLTCAAAYADHVVAERHVSALLDSATARLGRGASIHRNLRELVSDLSY